MLGYSLSPEAALSGEEDRLWSIVRANSLDFNAWTALIEETEKLAEVFINIIMPNFLIVYVYVF